MEARQVQNARQHAIERGAAGLVRSWTPPRDRYDDRGPAGIFVLSAALGAGVVVGAVGLFRAGAWAAGAARAALRAAAARRPGPPQ